VLGPQRSVGAPGNRHFEVQVSRLQTGPRLMMSFPFSGRSALGQKSEAYALGKVGTSNVAEYPPQARRGKTRTLARWQASKYIHLSNIRH
jgi:hypothetical protein